MTKNRYFSKDVTLTAKGIAIILMLFHHLFYDAPDLCETYAVAPFPFSMHIINKLGYFAKICVSIFVFLTGYGITINLTRRSMKERERYTVSRFLKLESGVLFIYILTFLSALILKPSLITQYFEEGRMKGILLIIIDATGLANFFNTQMINRTWWYLSLAIPFIFLMPVAVKLYEYFGVCTVVLACMVTSFGLDPKRAFCVYLPSLFFGIALAEGNILAKIESKCITLQKKLIYLCACIAGLGIFSIINIRFSFYPWTIAFISFFFVLTLYILIDLIKIRLRLLKLIGKYSMTIFLTHTLIYRHYFTKFIYAPKYWFLILLLLCAVSLATAIVIELLRKLVHWDQIRLWHLIDTL